jgi:hypothetical protein
LLPRRDLGDGLIDRALSPLFGCCIGGGALKKFALAALTFGPHLLVTQTPALLFLCGKAALLFFCSKTALLFQRSTSLLFLRSKTPLLLFCSKTSPFLLCSKTSLLFPSGIIAALAIHRTSVDL